MVRKLGILEKLRILGFKPQDGAKDIYYLDVQYKRNHVDTITISFTESKTGQIDWGKVLSLGRKTSSQLNKPESFVQLYWYIRLIHSGYSPNKIAIEKSVQLGRKKGFVDLVIYDNSDTPFMALM